jgi:hypothetical protein
MAILMSAVATAAVAQHRNGPPPRQYNGYYGNGAWVLPALLFGSLLVIEANRPIVVQQPTLPPPPYGYMYVNAFIPSCNCYQYVLVPIN